MTRSIGPFDGRTKRTRCTTCIRGHLKCDGGTPCKNCIRTHEQCSPAKTVGSIVFVHATTKVTTISRFQRIECNVIPNSIIPDDLSRYITHFNTSFLCSNSFTGGSVDQFRDVQSLLQDSPALQFAVMAVSALDVAKRGCQSRKPKYITALTYYRAGITSVQADLARPDLGNTTSVLWSTFFLGIFELMCDVTGEGWVKHFLHGTSALLQYRCATAHLSGAGRRFFLATRVFEISRALIYSSESFLAREDWCLLMRNMWSGADVKDWHPKEALFDLMITCSTLSMRAMKFFRSTNECPDDSYEIILNELAQDGFSLRSALIAWKASANQWSMDAVESLQDTKMMIALAYYHAASIYLSGIFDYHDHWNDRYIPTPILPSSKIQAHVSAILEVVGLALKRGCLAGILFFFPLRVAGARAKNLEQRREISRLLSQISNRGFVVADAFVMDLDELWESKPIEQSDHLYLEVSV